jgi:serine protease inhibitor
MFCVVYVYVASENTVLSSFSILTALLMTMSGARNETEAEILKATKLNKSISSGIEKNNELIALHLYMKQLTTQLTSSEGNSAGEANRLIIGNKIILNNQNVKDEFRNLVISNYNAKIDLIKSREDLTSVIASTNKWISDLTNNKIEKILDDDFKTASIGIINGIYFNYEWLYEFDPKLTQKEKFFIGPGTYISVDMMRLSKKSLPYYFSETLNAHLISLPYKNEKFFFNILYPADSNDFLLRSEQDSLINRIRYDILIEEFKRISSTPIELIIPKFIIKNELKVSTVCNYL